jgi:hypothetical protein
MRRLVAVLPLVALAACGRLDKVDITRSTSVTVPGDPRAGSLPPTAVSGLRIPLGSDLLREQGIDPKDVDGARLRQVHVEVKSGTSLEKWMDAITLRAAAPGLPTIVLAQKSGIRSLPAGTSAVDLDVPGDELKPYLDAPTAEIGADAAGNAPSAETVVEVTATIRVDVNVTGLLR